MKQILTLLLFLYLPYCIVAQTKITPEGNVPQCPGNVISYSASPAGGSASASYEGCSFKWSITSGRFLLTNSSNDYTTPNSTVDVIWDDVTNKGQLRVTITSCNNKSNDGTPTTGGVIIKSINGVTPSQVKVNNVAKTSHHIDYCSTAPLTLAIDRISIPNTPSSSNPSFSSTLYVDMYEWTLPTGWRTSDNKTGTFTTSSFSISVIPAAGSGGQVKVRGWNQECSTFSSPRVNFYSNYSTLTVTRDPQVGAITASRTNLQCGDRSPVNFSVPTVTGATSYTWSLPQGWTISGSATGNSISAIPSGTGGGQVSVAANLTCSTPAKAVSSTPITINYNSNLPAPVFSSAPYDIGTTATSYSIAPVTGATSYTWAASSNILINGQVPPLQSTSTTVTISQRPGYSGAGWVKVTANSPQCGSSSVTKDVWVGKPEILNFSISGSNKYPTCPYEQHTFAPVYSNGYQGQPSRYRWTVGNVSSHGDLTGSTLTVTAAGFNFSSRMSIGLEVETPLGWTQQFVMLYEIRDCDNGAEPSFAPNPVTEDEFTIETSAAPDEIYSYTLYDLQGNQHLSGKAKGKKTKVSTKGIPAGTYMLRVEHKGKSTTRRMVIEK